VVHERKSDSKFAISEKALKMSNRLHIKIKKTSTTGYGEQESYMLKRSGFVTDLAMVNKMSK